MSENRRSLEIKKQKLKEELSRPTNEQNKNKIGRLKDSIKRHKDIAKSIRDGKNRNRKHQ